MEISTVVALLGMIFLLKGEANSLAISRRIDIAFTHRDVLNQSTRKQLERSVDKVSRYVAVDNGIGLVLVTGAIIAKAVW